MPTTFELALIAASEDEPLSPMPTTFELALIAASEDEL